MDPKTRAHIIVSGRVQGLCFRAEVQKAAMIFGVSGWARNKPDGTVEVIAEGAKMDVTSLINWCKTGPPISRVEKVDVAWQDHLGEFSKFGIRF